MIKLFFYNKIWLFLLLSSYSSISRADEFRNQVFKEKLTVESNPEVYTEIVEKINLLQGKLLIQLPDGFRLMSKEMLAVKYPSTNRPTLVYTNESGSVNFAFNHTTNQITKDQLPEFLQAFIQQFNSLYPQIKWIKKETTVVNGKSFIVMEFITPAIDTRIYNLMYVTELQGRILMCSFNCTESLKAVWESKAKQALNSVEIK